MSEEPEVVETEPTKDVGEQGKTNRDMQTMSEHVEERTALDMGAIERAVDRLLQIREQDKKASLTTAARSPASTTTVKAEDIRYFMEKTGEERTESERLLSAAQGDLKRAFETWIKTPF